MARRGSARFALYAFIVTLYIWSSHTGLDIIQEGNCKTKGLTAPLFKLLQTGFS